MVKLCAMSVLRCVDFVEIGFVLHAQVLRRVKVAIPEVAGSV